MKHFLHLTALVFSVLLLHGSVTAQGLFIVNGADGSLLPPISSELEMTVTDQVAEVSCRQVFVNSHSVDTVGVYAFPLPEDAAAVRIRYMVNSTWYESMFSPSPQDTILPGEDTTSTQTDQTHPQLQSYLGASPIYFDMGFSVEAGAQVVFELHYVQLLSYGFNRISFVNPASYPGLGATSVPEFRFEAEIRSQRAMIGAELEAAGQIVATGVIHQPDSATVTFQADNWPLDDLIALHCDLVAADAQPIVFSTFLPDSISICDSLGNGFFGLLLEPEGDQTQIVNKDFILIIDRSGSMSGSGISQAKDAAHHILDNLNPNDRFNIVVFNSSSSAFAGSLQSVTASSISAGHGFINNLTATSMTNISSSFDMAIPMFATSAPEAAKIVVFMTDGAANQGITGTPQLVAHVNGLVANAGLSYDFSLYSFGVAGANEQLLNQLSNQNNGAAFYISSANFGVVMSDFYNTIQNPVILNTQLSFDPPSVSSVYPASLPNLYLGQQLAVFGRYDQPGEVTVTLSGFNFGNPVSHQYVVNLVDHEQPDKAFLLRLWAKKYISYLMTQYYNENNLSGAVADSLRQLVIGTSLCYGVLSPFTSFQSDDDDHGVAIGIEELQNDDEARPGNQFTGVYPNPFTDEVFFDLTDFLSVAIEVYDVQGRVVWTYQGDGGGILKWSGNDDNGSSVVSGLYMFRLQGDGVIYWGRVHRI